MAGRRQPGNRSPKQNKLGKLKGPLVQSKTRFLEFSADRPFEYHAGNASPATLQKGKRREHYLTTSSQFARGALMRNPQVFTIHNQARDIPCLDPKAWPKTDFGKQRVLFVLPSQALGNNVCIWFFLQAFLERFGPRAIGVCCTESSSDFFRLDKSFKVHGLWISRKQLDLWDYVVDLGQLESRQDIDLWPIDMEVDLLNAFELPPSQRFDGAMRSGERPARLKIGLFPMASSPLRTLPPETVEALATGLKAQADVTLISNSFQSQGRLLLEGLNQSLLADINVIESFPSIGDLLFAIKNFDYVVMADSGPAHMTKFFGTPGMAVYTSAPADVLQGRFTNMAAWTVPYKGEFCATPCGLAKVRQNRAGDVGCMGSLNCSLEDLPSTPTGQQPGLIRKFFEEPVPCVERLAQMSDDLVAAVKADIRHRLG
jgi:ADP-heptose:LPS heptosyltransferase